MDIKAHLGQKVTLQWISVKQNLLTVNVILNQQLMDHYFQLLSLHFVYISLEFWEKDGWLFVLVKMDVVPQSFYEIRKKNLS